MKTLEDRLRALPEELDSHPEVVALQERTAKLAARKQAAEAKLASLEAAAAAGMGRTSREKVVLALAAGEELPGSGPSEDEMKVVRREVSLLEAAVSVVGRQESEARAKVGMEVAKELRPLFSEEWGKLARLGVAFSEGAAELDSKYDHLRSAGIPFSAYCPFPSPVGFADAREKDSRINRFISEIEEEYGLTIPRKVLAETEEKGERVRREAGERQLRERQATEATQARRRLVTVRR